MATYIQGVTDYIPQIQAFKPDFNFYSKSLQMSQSKYDANHDKLSSLYGSLLNSPMLREQNIEQRDQFFKMIDQDIKKMSSMDLSKQQNIDSASTVFNQLLDNKNIVKDMTWTKNWQSQHRRADGFKNCVDPEKCGGAWWEGGVNALNYQAEEFKTVDDAEAMNFGSANFTPYQDVMSKAIKLAKEADLNISRDVVSGGWITTTKNGPEIVRPLASLFTGVLGRDPKIMEYYTTKAYVDRKNFVQGNTPAYGSPEAAEAAWSQQIMQKLQPDLKKTQEDLEYTQENLANKRKQIEQQVAEQGTTPGSPLAQFYAELNGTEEAVAGSLGSIKEANGNITVAMNNKMSRAALKNLDRALAGGYLQNDIKNAAETLAYKDYEISKEADPYSLENVKHKHNLIMEGARQENRKELEEYKIDLEAKGTVINNEGYLVQPFAGSNTVDVSTTAAYDQYKQDRTEIVNTMSRSEKEMLTQAFSLAQTSKDNPTANTDLLSFVDALVERDPTFLSNDPAVVAKYKRLGAADKLSLIQNQNIDYATKILRMKATDVDHVYDKVLYPKINRTQPKNAVAHHYLQTLWTDPKNVRNRMDIQAKDSVIAQLDKKNQKNTTFIKKMIRDGESKYREYADGIDALITNKGIAKTKEQFVKNYVDNAVKRAPKQMYVERATGNQVPEKADTWMPTSDEPVPTDYNIIKQDAAEDAADIYDNIMDDEDGLYQVWKEAWSDYTEAEGVTKTQGTGSDVVEYAHAHEVDPVAFQSDGVVGTNGFVKDMRQAKPDEAKYTLSDPSAGIPEENDPEAITFVNQLIKDINTRTSPKDKGRPIPTVTFQNVAGTSNEWTMMNIKITDDYAKQFIGSEANPGLLWGKRTELQENGVNLYLKKNASTNQFYINNKATPLETVLDYNGKYELDDYPEYTRKLEIDKLEDGGYNMTGQIAYNIDENGNLMYGSIGKLDFTKGGDINVELENWKQKVYYPLINEAREAQARYNLNKGVKKL